MSTSARILLADAELLFRTALRLALEDEDDLTVTAEASTGDEAVAELAATHPDVALLAVELPGAGAAEVCAAARQLTPRCCVLVLDTEPCHANLLASLEAGADGYLTSDQGFEHLVESTRAVLRGEAAVPPTMLGGLLHHLIQRRRHDDAGVRKFERLSRRERQVLAAIASGKGVVETAEELVISTQTARTHIQNVLSKLEVHSRIEAVAFAFEPAIQERLTVS
ncbi:MAG: LuxR C-terminal-related transcriptional regulator [Mycobacteriales bacterium]